MDQPGTFVRHNAYTADYTQTQRDLAALIVEALNLDCKPDEIGLDAPLFGEGLGLDSIDALELSLALSKEYGFELKSTDPENPHTFSSLRALADHVDRNRNT